MFDLIIIFNPHKLHSKSNYYQSIHTHSNYQPSINRKRNHINNIDKYSQVIEMYLSVLTCIQCTLYIVQYT